MKKLFVALFHLGFWACYLMSIIIILAVAYRNSATITDRELRIANALKSLFFFAILPSFLSFNLFYFLLFPKFVQQKKFLLSILYGLLITTLAAVICYILLRYFIETGRIIDMDSGGKHGRSTAGINIMVMTIIGIVCGVVALVIRGFITWFNEIKLKQALMEKNHEMEMALIKAQLDPHLLFNTINNIDALILRDSVKASAYLNQLSDIMRFVLYETRAEKILLSQEIEYIEKYIALQKIRSSNETYVHFSVAGNAGTKRIAPMVFIPFIENAFKHTNNKKLENAITIRIEITDATTKLICENKFDPTSVKQPVGGLGNELARKRLELIYAGKHTLEVSRTNDLYRAHLTIPND